MVTRKTWLVLVGLGVLAAVGMRWRPAVELAVVHPQEREVIELVIASGKLRAVRQSDLGLEVSSTIEEVRVDFGDQVEVGQRLIVLRQADAQQELERAQAQAATAREELARTSRPAYPEDLKRAEAELERTAAARRQAELDFERLTKLFAERVNSPTEVDQGRSALDQARAAEQVAREILAALRQQPRPEEVRIAEARLREKEAAVRVAEQELAKRTLVAPFSGVILARFAQPGQSVVPGTALLTLAEVSQTEVYVETDENNLRRLRVGQVARVIAPAYAREPFRAVLTQIGPGVDYDRGVVGLRLKPESLPAYARMNMTVDVNLEVGRLPPQPSVPLSSLVSQDEKTQVWIVEGGRLVNCDVVVKGRGREWAAVDGLSTNALVALQGTAARAGQRMRPKLVPTDGATNSFSRR